MITAWQIYWVMQLDSIGCVLNIISIVTALVAGGCLMAGGVEWDVWKDYDSGNKYKDAARAKLRIGRKAGVFAALVLLAAAFVPSTKTAAMMLVIPAVANNEAIQREAGDLYGIAKDALRELARPKPEKGRE